MYTGRRAPRSPACTRTSDFHEPCSGIGSVVRNTPGADPLEAVDVQAAALPGGDGHPRGVVGQRPGLDANGRVRGAVLAALHRVERDVHARAARLLGDQAGRRRSRRRWRWRARSRCARRTGRGSSPRRPSASSAPAMPPATPAPTAKHDRLGQQVGRSTAAASRRCDQPHSVARPTVPIATPLGGAERERAAREHQRQQPRRRAPRRGRAAGWAWSGRTPGRPAG